MNIKMLGRTIEVTNNRINIDSFKNEKFLIGTSINKRDIKNWDQFKRLLMFCFMPYKWLNEQFMNGII